MDAVANRGVPVIVAFAQTLTRHPGHAFCESCLAQKSGADLVALRDAKSSILRDPVFQAEEWFCSVCLQFRPVLHVRWLDGETSRSEDVERPAAAYANLRFQLEPYVAA